MGNVMRRRSPNQRCKACKESVVSSRIYCERLREYVDDLVYCPHFEPRTAPKIYAT